jgi:DHA1 family multidrug resistance protein-like MFS transporter
MSASDVLFESLLRPFQLMLEPAVLYINIYLALAYAIFYREHHTINSCVFLLWDSRKSPSNTVWFEAFPLVYFDIYHFNLGTSGLPFLGLMVSAIITGIGYVCWNYYYVEPQFRKTGTLVPESRLLVALLASVFIPMSLFIYGWCLMFLDDPVCVS